ncbi:MAG: hypothetical protein K1X86_16395 [Ignavibacteria bacterium]|nr:hypothetical protein [Ignavibacteria bacterium]
MIRTLGLDIGTNSIGWCLIENGKEIIDTGIRIFPKGVNYSTKGKEISKNALRRDARSIRRLYDRYKQRRKILVKLLRVLEMMPSEQMQNLPSMELYGLRKKALDKKISLQELGRIFLLLNQRRGFKSSKKSLNKNTEEAVH